MIIKEKGDVSGERQKVDKTATVEVVRKNLVATLA
jgi:hypothetical protein